ncbi:MAG TPA: glutamate-cysteine ligase family protein [Gemmatimonadales bacterium]|nr:glutamate-cysteine ligase family protein [Gemmatimonadales bacterium]
MSRVDRGALLAHLSERAFAAPPAASLTPRRLGAEIELIPVEAASGRRVPLESEAGLALLPLLRRFGARQGWAEARTPKGAPCFLVRGGGLLGFEPGGQLEYSSPPSPSVSALVNRLRSVVLPLRAAASAEGIDLLAVGVDPYNRAGEVPLQLHCDRYRRMAEHFARIGPLGAVMMRQSASVQVSLDFDDEPRQRWRLLNAAAPFVTAIFANSPVHAGADTGHRSWRAHAWRQLDPRRTGLPFDAERPVEAYLDFALGAPAILYPTVGERCLPFGEWLARANPTIDEWEAHLSTLFPEVRPRGHCEVRSADAVDPAWYAAPLALLAGLAYDPHAARGALDLLPAPDPGLLERAGRDGLGDPAIARTAADLFELALAGCRALGPGFVHPSHLEEARAYFDRYTRRGRSPADDVVSEAAAA